MRSPLLCCIALLCIGLPAQLVTSPPGYLTVEGGRFASYFGGFEGGRYQYLDGEWRGKPLAIKEIAYRLDARDYTTGLGVGRRWGNVTVDIAECDVANRTRVFSRNYLTTPTRVFSGAVVWDSKRGVPKRRPSAWGGDAGRLRFPFGATYVHTGRKDLCTDYKFRGGVLANGATWTSSAIRSYFLDGNATGSFHFGGQIPRGVGAGDGGCVDGGTANKWGGYGFAYSYTYGPSYPIVTFRNKMRLYTSSYFTAIGKPVVHALGFSGNTRGLPLPGVTCNRVYPDLTKPLVLSLLTASSTTSAFARRDFGFVPFQPAAVGTELWFQPAWSDSKTGALKLGRAVQSEVVGMPKTFRRYLVYYFRSNSPSGLGPYDQYYMHPVVRFAQ